MSAVEIDRDRDLPQTFLVVIKGIFVKRILIVEETNGIERANALQPNAQIDMEILNLVVSRCRGVIIKRNMEIGENISKYTCNFR